MKAFDGFRELFRKLSVPIKSEIGKISKIILNNYFSFFCKNTCGALLAKKAMIFLPINIYQFVLILVIEYS